MENKNPLKYGKYAKYTHKRLLSPKKFKQKSFRTIKEGRKGKKITLGILKGERRRTKSGRIKMMPQSVLIPKKLNPMPVVSLIGRLYMAEVLSIKNKKSVKIRIDMGNGDTLMYLSADKKNILIYPIKVGTKI